MSMLVDAYRFGTTGGDPFWANVASLLHFNGTDGSTVFTDQTGKTWTSGGNAQIDTSQFMFGGASAQFDGTGDYVQSPASADYQFGTGDLTVEKFVRFGSLAGFPTISDSRVGAAGTEWVLYYNTTSSSLRLFADGADRILGSSVLTDTWYHLAWTRASGTSRLFLAGNQIGSDYADANNYQRDMIRLGLNNSGASGYAGHMDELRITKGVARYTTNFTPPSAEFPGF